MDILRGPNLRTFSPSSFYYPIVSAVRFLSQFFFSKGFWRLSGPFPCCHSSSIFIISSIFALPCCCYPKERRRMGCSSIGKCSRTYLQFHVILKLEHSTIPRRKRQHFTFPSPPSSSYSSLSASAANDDDRHALPKSETSIERQIAPYPNLYRHHQHQLATALLNYADSGNITETQITWSQILNSSFKPTIHLVSSLITKLAKNRNYDEIHDILTQLESRGDFPWLPQIYSLAVSCFGTGGRLDLMESTLKQMSSSGFPIDSVTSNSYVVYYSIFGSLSDTESAYLQLKKSRILIDEEAIKAVSFRFLREKKFYSLGEFLRDVGLGRRNVGNLLWNLLILSYAVNFKMKSLQREFIGMIESGFKPDLTTFNIRAIAFAKMNLFWDLHLSLEHMRFEGIDPDLVTYGCVVDAYVDKRFVRNLDFGLSKMGNLDDVPVVGTDEFVFQALGKGDFHLSSEAFMEFSDDGRRGGGGGSRRWNYRKLVQIYLKKQRRINQIFWNY